MTLKHYIIFIIAFSVINVGSLFLFLPTDRLEKPCIVYDNKTDEYRENLRLLTCLIQSESGTENFIDKLYVGSVVLNWMRIKDQCMHDVIYKPYKFSGVHGSGFRYDSESERAAKMLLDYGPIDTTAIYFLNPKASTDRGWIHKVMQREMVFKSTNHIFYK
jgi:spore germination cell wall hydrolase CwlJ-like protein